VPATRLTTGRASTVRGAEGAFGGGRL